MRKIKVGDVFWVADDDGQPVEVVNVAVASELLDMPRRTIQQALQDGDLEGYKQGPRAWTVSKKVLDRIIEDGWEIVTGRKRGRPWQRAVALATWPWKPLAEALWDEMQGHMHRQALDREAKDAAVNALLETGAEAYLQQMREAWEAGLLDSIEWTPEYEAGLMKYLRSLLRQHRKGEEVVIVTRDTPHEKRSKKGGRRG